MFNAITFDPVPLNSDKASRFWMEKTSGHIYVHYGPYRKAANTTDNLASIAEVVNTYIKTHPLDKVSSDLPSNYFERINLHIQSHNRKLNSTRVKIVAWVLSLPFLNRIFSCFTDSSKYKAYSPFCLEPLKERNELRKIESAYALQTATLERVNFEIPASHLVFPTELLEIFDLMKDFLP